MNLWYLNPLLCANVMQSDWEFFAAAVTSKQVREEIVESVALWLNETRTDK